MIATIFVSIENKEVTESLVLTETKETAEECVEALGERLGEKLGYIPRLTFRPADGMIFCGDMSIVTPIGVLYRAPYLQDK